LLIFGILTFAYTHTAFKPAYELYKKHSVCTARGANWVLIISGWNLSTPQKLEGADYRTLKIS